jgi:tetraprenyl-beta-curcumene synthase
MARMYVQILPEVNQQLTLWRERAHAIPNEELRTQALASMNSKKFHCQGGASYALLTSDTFMRKRLIAWIVAFQTISDYLDNLCDRSTSLDATDFRCLHQAMLDAADEQEVTHDYYAQRDERDDAGYLQALVECCQRINRELPSFSGIREQLRELVSLYCDLQVYKHIAHDQREQALATWWSTHQQRYPHLEWQEFAAATGSTLGMFCFIVASAKPHISRDDANLMREQYFPAICGLHIMLDYLIDREEDQAGGDLNFCFYYRDDVHMLARIRWIIETAQQAAKQLPNARFHEMIVDGLLAVYLSDGKMSASTETRQLSKRLLAGGPWRRMFFYWNSLWVRKMF